MAKLCMLARERRRTKASSKPNEVRDVLKKQIKDPELEYEEKLAAMRKLDKRARDESAVRGRTRCFCCGRPRSVYRKFKLCRICLRKWVHAGLLPGMRKASW